MRVGALYAVLRLETGAFHSALDKSGGAFSRFMGVIKAGGFLAAQGLAVVAAASLAMAASFETHMNQSLAIMGDVSDGMRERMEDAARAVAKTTTFSANEAADAYYYLASAGYDAANSIELLPVVTKFAQAGVMDLDEATSYLMDSQTTLGLRTKDVTKNMENMTRVSDVLSKAQIESNATLEQMAQALTNKAGPALRAVHKDIEEGAAVLMVMANNGLKGKAAGTALGIVLRELQTKALKNKDAFKEMGIAVYDSKGNMNNMADIIGDLEGKLGGMSDAQKKATLLQLGFTDRSVGFIQQLLGQSDAIRKYEKDLRSAGGATEEVATKQLDTFQAQMEIAWHKIQDVAISIGQRLLPAARSIVEGFGDWIDKNHELITTIAVGLIDGVGELIGIIATLVGWAVKAGQVIVATLKPAFDTITAAMQPVIFWVQAIFKNFDQLEGYAGDESPLGMIGTLVERLGAGFQWVSDNVIPVFADAFDELATDVIPVLVEAITAIVDEALPVLSEAFTVIAENVLPFFIEVFRTIIDDILPRLVDLFTVIMSTVLPALGVAFDFVATEILPRIGAAFDWLRTDVIPPLQSIFEFVVSWFIANWPTISSIVTQVFGAVGEAFKIVANVIGFIVPIIWGIVQPIAAVLFPIVGAAASLLLSALDITFRAIGGVFDVFGDVATGIFRALTAVWDGLGDFFGGILDDVAGAFKGGLNVVIDIINGFIRFLNNLHIDIPRVNIPGTDIGVGGGAIDPFNIGTIPHLARGTRNFLGGLALVGENGPELAYLPRGSGVIPAGETASMLGAQDVTVHVKDDDGAIRAGGYSQDQLETVLTEGLRALVGGAHHRSLRVGS